MSSTRSRKVTLDIDTRTDTMSEEALRCRARGHAWDDAPISRVRRLELLRLGQVEELLVCLRCRGTWSIVRELPSFEVVSQVRRYAEPETYLVAKGSGRMRRIEAGKALFARALGSV